MNIFITLLYLILKKYFGMPSQQELWADVIQIHQPCIVCRQVSALTSKTSKLHIRKWLYTLTFDKNKVARSLWKKKMRTWVFRTKGFLELHAPFHSVAQAAETFSLVDTLFEEAGNETETDRWNLWKLKMWFFFF